MKPRSLLWPFALLAVAWLAFAIYVWFSAGQLPERVATHFGANGVPNGWLTHAGYIRFTLIFGTAVPAFVLGTFVLVRHLNGWGLNIPHKEYWLAPERREETFDFVQRQGVWLAGLMLAFLAGVHYAIIAANARTPASLPPAFFILVGAFLVATLACSVTLIRHFFRKPA